MKWHQTTRQLYQISIQFASEIFQNIATFLYLLKWGELFPYNLPVVPIVIFDNKYYDGKYHKIKDIYYVIICVLYLLSNEVSSNQTRWQSIIHRRLTWIKDLNNDTFLGFKVKQVWNIFQAVDNVAGQHLQDNLCWVDIKILYDHPVITTNV